jgi:uncharacterized protein (DUF2164 family)
MNKVKPSWDFLSDETRKTILEELMRFYKSEFDQEIGMIMADVLLDKFLELAAVDIYNEGVDSTERLVEDRISDLKMELYMLRKIQ